MPENNQETQDNELDIKVVLPSKLLGPTEHSFNSQKIHTTVTNTNTDGSSETYQL